MAGYSERPGEKSGAERRALSPEDGGPAFPQLSIVAGKRDGHGDLLDPITSSQGGMSMRDWFAGMALQGIIDLLK